MNRNIYNELKKFKDDDYQNRGDNCPNADVPDTIEVYLDSIEISFKDTSEIKAKKWLYRFLTSKDFIVNEDDIHTYQDGEYKDDWVVASCKLTKISK